MPKIEFRCNAKPSLFAYPPPLEEKKKEEAEKVESAVLSITNKKKQQLKEKEKAKDASKDKPKVKEDEKMEVDVKNDEKDATKKDEKNKDAVKESKEPKEAPEPSTFNVKNPARVVRLQLKTLQVLDESRYKPLKNLNHGGIIILKDSKPDEKEDIVALVPAGGSTNAPGSANPDFPVPAAFEITLTNY
uniref:26S proteasome regulatory subunit RPN2 C-terminal domain-containing protein n=1 Tax=Panagrolaimus sp. ES5 TaxID=591445 RepID=A0AC34GYE8_9BILA